MTPSEQAAELYRLHPGGRTFAQDLAAHLRHGYVASTPEYFVMGRPVARAGGAERIRNPDYAFPLACCDTWFVFIFTGATRNGLQFIPYELRWIAWDRARGNELRFYDYLTIQKKCSRIVPFKIPA